MQWLALREAWWPLAVAVAWVLLRSRPVVEQLLDRHPRKPITFTAVATYAAALKAGGKHTTPELENSEAAFRELRHHLETGEIEVVGTPFSRVGDLQGSSRLEMGNQHAIFYTEISSLVHFNDRGVLCLIPRDWRAARGSARTNLRGYRNVLVRSAALVRAFPEERKQLTHVPSDAVVDAEGATPYVPGRERLPETVKRVVVIGANVSEVPYDENVATVQLKKPKRGRPAEYNWDGVKARLLDYISQHGPMQTLDELMQKCADFASDLHPKKSTPSDKTIREAIETHALGIAAGFSPGKSPGK